MPKIVLTLDVDDQTQARLINALAEGATVDAVEMETAKPETVEVANDPAPDAPLDVRGVPWNSQYHAGTKTKNGDGSWKRKRGGDKAAADHYENQYIGDNRSGAPEAEETKPGVMPEMPDFLKRSKDDAPAPGPALPGMGPVATLPEPAPEPAPITVENVTEAFARLTDRVGAQNAALAAPKVYGANAVTDVNVLNTNESARAGVYNQFEALNAENITGFLNGEVTL